MFTGSPQTRTGFPQGFPPTSPQADGSVDIDPTVPVTDLAIRGLAIGRAHPARVMAIINVSPESFYAASVAAGEQAVRDAVRRAEDDGADIVDIGAMSTAPYKQATISEFEECDRMARAVAAARAATDLAITADTQRAAVARAALKEGADAVNDVTGFDADPEMAYVAAEFGVPAILMASERPGETAFSGSPVEIVMLKLRGALKRAYDARIPKERCILDPGLGFFRNQTVPWYEFDMEIMRQLGVFVDLRRPILVSASRKSFIGKLLDRPDPEHRLGGSLAAALHCARMGASVIRTHDPAATKDALRMMGMLDATPRP